MCRYFLAGFLFLCRVHHHALLGYRYAVCSISWGVEVTRPKHYKPKNKWMPPSGEMDLWKRCKCPCGLWFKRQPNTSKYNWGRQKYFSAAHCHYVNTQNSNRTKSESRARRREREAVQAQLEGARKDNLQKFLSSKNVDRAIAKVVCQQPNARYYQGLYHEHTK